jgi:DNA polymerase elongation subunit (family B)
MYQAIYYDKGEKQYYLRDDSHSKDQPFKTVTHWPTYYVEHEDGEMETLLGKRVTPISKMDNWKDPKYYEKDVDRDTRFLVDKYFESDDTPSYHNIVYLDIECEIAGALTPQNIKNPKGKITAIALYDNNKQKYYCLVLDEGNKMKTTGDKKKRVIPYLTEAELLKGFLQLWINIDPTIVTGWNSAYFDMPYLYNRIKDVLGEEIASYMSPINKVAYNDYNTDDPMMIGGINHLDYMLLFKKYITKQEPSYRLGDIGKKYAKLDKIDYQGSLDRLFEEDVDKFIDYNIRDVEIIVELEQVMKFIELTVTICHLCHTTYETIYFSTVLNDGAILTYLKRKGIVSPNKPTTYNPGLKDISIKKAKFKYQNGEISKKEYDDIVLAAEYAGGYLKDPVPGLYEWVIDLDFTSLYPSIIRSLNIGIETLVGRIVNRDKYDNQWSLKELKAMNPTDEVEIELLNSNYTTSRKITQVGKIVKQIEQQDLLISAPGVIFRKDKSSVVCEILSDWFDKRVEYKNKMKKAYKSGDKVMGEFYNKRQHAYKIKLNDVYGVFAINGWRYTDGHKIISKAITLTGQRLTQDSIKFVNKWINEQLGTDKDYIVTSDTDSLFAQVKDLILHRKPELANADRETIVQETLKVAEEIQELANQNLHVMAQELFNIKYPDEPHYFELKQEVVLERGYFSGKRRYAQFIVNKEGVPTEELDMKGLDLMKSNFPPMFREFGERILKEIMFGTSKESIDKQVLEFRESLRTVDWKRILKPTGLKKLEEYIGSPPNAGEVFSRLKLKCPINTKAAIFYNDMLRFKNLHEQYPTFQVGDKMYIAYLKENPFRIDVIGFNGYNDPPEILEFISKYIDRDGLFDGVIKNKLENVYMDIGWGMPIFNRKVNKFFQF